MTGTAFVTEVGLFPVRLGVTVKVNVSVWGGAMVLEREVRDDFIITKIFFLVSFIKVQRTTFVVAVKFFVAHRRRRE
jgi:hypothetical protein